MKAPIYLFSTLILFAFYGVGTAQDVPPPEVPPSFGQAALEESVRASYLSPDSLNELLEIVKKPKSIHEFIDATNLRFIAYEPTMDNSEAGLGIAYDYDRALAISPSSPWIFPGDPENPIGGSFNFHAKGKIAFDQSLNPNDFLDTGLSIHAFQLIQGNLGEVDSDALRKWALLSAQADTDDPEVLNQSAEWQNFMSELQPLLSSDIFWDVSGHASLESNQDFSETQYAYGVKAAMVARIWNPKNARWNVLDWPFALTRKLTKEDKSFTPSGHAIPSILIGIDGVDPTDVAGRLEVDPDVSVYPRLRGEVSFKTKAGQLPISGKDIWFSASYRQYYEIGSSSAIEAAGMNDPGYVALSLGLVDGFYLSYTKGKLPLDVENEQVLGVGYKIHF